MNLEIRLGVRTYGYQGASARFPVKCLGLGIRVVLGDGAPMPRMEKQGYSHKLNSVKGGRSIRA